MRPSFHVAFGALPVLLDIVYILLSYGLSLVYFIINELCAE